MMIEAVNEKEIVEILYTNWKGVTRKRVIVPISIEFKETTWHPDKQWILNAIDLEKGEERGFAIADIKAWKV